LIGGALRQDGTPKVLVATMCFPFVTSAQWAWLSS
jgi:hypothetical protein